MYILLLVLHSCLYCTHMTKVCSHLLLLLFIVTMRVSFILLTIKSSMNGLNILRSIVILFIIILSMMPFKLISVSSKDQLVDIFTKPHSKGGLRDLVGKLKLVSHPPWVWGGLLTCIMLWALGSTRLLV